MFEFVGKYLLGKEKVIVNLRFKSMASIRARVLMLAGVILADRLMMVVV